MKIILNSHDLDERISGIANKISSDYRGHELVLIGILKGAFIFLADLVRHLTIPVKIDFMCVSSYGLSDSSSGRVSITKGIELDIEGKDVLLIEDIVDTGWTMAYILDYLKPFNPKTVKVCTLIDKRERRRIDVKIHYACHKSDRGFLVGYGLDYAEDYRYLSGIHMM